MSTKIVHTGDWHYGVHPLNNTSKGINQREQDFYKAGEVLINYIINDIKPDVVVLAGDSYHITRPEPHTLTKFFRNMKKLVDAGIEVIIIGGNHDTPARIGKESPLAILEEILGIHLFLEQGSKEVAGVKFHAMPYRTLASDMVVPFEYSDKIPNVFIGHATVPSDIIPAFIKDLVEIPLEMCDAPEHAVSLLGHIHMHRKVTEKGYYSGGIEMINFGEVNNEPAIWVHDVSDDGKVETESIKIKDMGGYMVPRPVFNFEFDVEGWDENEDVSNGVIEKLNTITPSSLVRVVITNSESSLRKSSFVKEWRRIAYEDKKCFYIEIKIQSKSSNELMVEETFGEDGGIEQKTNSVVSIEQAWKIFLEERQKQAFLERGLKMIRGVQEE